MINSVLINDLDFPQIIVTMKPQISENLIKSVEIRRIQ